MRKVTKLLFLLFAMPFVTMAGNVTVTSVAVNQRDTLSGVVDIIVTIRGAAEDVSKTECSFFANNSENGTAIPVAHVSRDGNDTGTDSIWTRKYVWDVAADVDVMMVADIALTVDGPRSYVRLWEGGPFWAKCNLGATTPEDFGYYFGWGNKVGDTERRIQISMGEEVRSIPVYKQPTLVYYGTDTLQRNGYIDTTGNLVAAYDAATERLGASWRMPTAGDFDALIKNCTMTHTNSGFLVTGKGRFALNQIFLPANGFVDAATYGYGFDLYNYGHGYYWSSTPSEADSERSRCLCFGWTEDSIKIEHLRRDRGQNIRPVRDFGEGVTVHLMEWKQQPGLVIRDESVLYYSGDCPEYVAIPEGVQQIADGAFRNCGELVSITLPSTLRCIGANAFEGCTNLECVELPEGLESIGDGAFRNCTWMQEVSFPSSLTNIGVMAFANCTMLENVECYDGLQSVGESAFSNCWRMLSVALPATVDSIGTRAFYNCKNVLGVTLPAHIDTIAHMFPDVYRTLQSVAVAEGETELVAGFFSGCEMLEEIVLSNAIKEIPDSTFEGCMELLRMRFPAELERIGNRAFYGCQKLTSLAFPDELISIGNSAFYGCSRVVELSFGENLREIGDDAFYGLPKIPNIVCPASVRSIGARAFLGVWDDVEIKLPEGLESLGVNAFAGCPSIRRVSLPALPTPIKSAFPAAYPQIQSVNILGTPGVIGQGFCQDVVQLSAIHIPASVTNIQGYAFSGLSNLAEIELPPNLCVIGECAFRGNSRLTTIALPQSVEWVGNSAFYGCNNIRVVSCSGELGTLSSLFPSAYSQITTVSINEGNVRLIDDLMSGCANLSDIDLPFGITSIGDRAFKNCGALAAFGVPNGVVALGNDVFSGCSGLTSLSLPEGLESIPSGAFRNCYAISSIVIPASVTYIGAEAFYGCSALMSVAYLGYCPQFDSGCYSGTPTDLSSYVVFGSRGWDGIPTSKTLPEYWPTVNARAIAYWEPNTFDATFVGNGGTPPSSMVAQTTGMTYILPENDPEMLGARFNGWWTHPVNGGRIKTTTKVEVTRAQTFYAHWKYNDYLIRFDANGGVGEMEDQMLTVNAPAELAANSFFRKGYRFSGWSLSSEGEASFADGDEVGNLSFEHNAVVTLYAVWAEQPWDAADYLNAPGRMFVFDGDAEWFADDDVSHDGTGSLRSGVIAAAADGQRTTSVLRTSVVGTGAGSFWWKIDCEPADGIDYFDYCAFFIDGVEVAKIAGTVGWEKVNYEVAGEGEHALEWVFSRDDWDEDEALYENAAWVDEFEWAPTPVTLSFDANGAEGEAPVSVIKYAGCEVSLPLASTLTKDGMIFVGWSDGVGVFLPGDTYVLGSSDAVLYAVWDDKIWTLEEAANITGISFATGGDTDWMVDLATNYDGVASIKSGSIGDNQQTWVSMAVSGPGTIGFRTFVSGEFYRGRMCDYLKFEVDGSELFTSYDANWSNVVVAVSGNGEHILKWTYLKNSSKSTGYDCAWLDEVVWTPSAIPSDPIPDIGEAPTVQEVQEALYGSEDGALSENIHDGVSYNAYREWATAVKTSDGSAVAGHQAVKESPSAWLSFAFGVDALIGKELTSDDVKIESFSPASTVGKFDFTVSVKDVNIGGGSIAEAVLKENLKKVLGVEGAKSLSSGAFSSDNIDITFGSPVNGKAKFFVSPPADAGNSFFMRVKVK